MNKHIRTLLLLILAIIVIILVALYSINTFIKNKVATFVETRLPQHITKSYDDLNFSILEGTITFKNATVIIKNKQNLKTHTKVNVAQFIIEDISYWDYIFKNEIHIEDIKLKTPKIIYYKNEFVSTSDSIRNPLLQLYKPVLIDELSIDNTTFTIIDNTKDSIALYAQNLTIEVDDVFIDNKTLVKRLPVNFGDYNAKADSIFLKLNTFENISTTDFFLKKRKAIIKNIHLKTKYSENQLSQIIKKERDYFNVSIDSIIVNEIDFGFTNRKFFAKSTSIIVEKPSMFIYRDKLVADDNTIKPLYSKMLRELPINLSINNFNVNNGNLTYTERVKAENKGGTIDFSEMKINIKNISNTYSSPNKTQIDINAIFMKNTPFKIDWSFDVNNTNDLFLLKADVGQMAAVEMNQFTQPNLGVKLEGITNKTYMTMSGDDYQSHFDMKVKYEDFKVSIMDDSGTEKKKLLSFVANIFVRKNSTKDDDNFREGSGDVTRDRTKSFFNYMWLAIKEGLLKSMTGRNKKN